MLKALAAELSSAQGKLFAVQCDLSKEDDILRMFQTINEEHGGVDVCINNAGMSHIASILEGKTSDWKEMFEVGVSKVFNENNTSTHIGDDWYMVVCV